MKKNFFIKIDSFPILKFVANYERVYKLDDMYVGVSIWCVYHIEIQLARKSLEY